MNLKLSKTDNQSLISHVSGMYFRQHIEELLLRVRSENAEVKEILRNVVEFDPDDDGTTWLGIYNKKSHPFFYIGIQLTEKKHPRYEMYVQAAWLERSAA